MQSGFDFPSFDHTFPEIDHFILTLVDEYKNGSIDSWDDLDDKVKTFYTSDRMDEIDARAPGWKKMASYSNGITLTHVSCVFLGMFMLPEFLALSQDKQQIAKWIILFHDIDKSHIRGKKDVMHAFNSAVVTANTLPKLGFPTSVGYSDQMTKWSEYTRQAFVHSENGAAAIPDNQKLPKILSEIDRFFGKDTPAAIITKVVLLHISLDVDKNYPTPAPLSEIETQRLINPSVLPPLRVMMLSDNEGWSLFEPEIREQQRRDALASFERVEKLIAKGTPKGAK